MPELPEVEYARARLSRWTAGARLLEVRSFDERVAPDREAFARIAGARVLEVTRRGKNLLVHLANSEESNALWIHLGMTGHLAKLTHGTPLTQRALPRFTRWALATPECVVALTDVRRFAKIVAAPLATIVANHLSKLGPEADAVTAPSLARVLDTRLAVKAALMKQARLAGLGNIHAAEALFLAKIHPERAARSLSRPEVVRLATGIRDALARATIPENEELAYVSEGGPNPFFVYGREGEPCPKCRTAIARELVRGRSNYFCPKCQASRATTRPRAR